MYEKFYFDFYNSISLFFFYKKENKEKQVHYYFCTSSVWSKYKNTSDKKFFTYTTVHKIAGNESDIRKKTKEWADYINAQCSNTGGCTSDLNIYDTKEQAEKVYREILKDYTHSGSYILRKVKF